LPEYNDHRFSFSSSKALMQTSVESDKILILLEVHTLWKPKEYALYKV